MQTKENLSQTVKDVKVEIIKDVFKKQNTANAEELLDAIEEGVRKFVRTTLEVYAKDEFLRYIGARPYERTNRRKDYRNGSLSKTIFAPFRPTQVIIPRGRKAGFVSKVVERFKIFKPKITRIVVNMFTLGISTRKIKKITRLIAGKEISKTEVSRLNKTIKAEITAWLNRPIKKKFSHLFIDGVFLKIRRKIISREAILCAVGMTESGEKEFFGFLPACLSADREEGNLEKHGRIFSPT